MVEDTNATPTPKFSSQFELPKRSVLSSLFAAIRFLTFAGVIVIITLNVFPTKSFSLTSVTGPGLFLGGFMLLVSVGGVLYFILAPAKEGIGVAFDFESLLAVVLGAVAFLILGSLALSSAARSEVILFGLVLLGIYMFYLYRIIRETLRLKAENDSIRHKYGELIEVERQKTDFITVTSHQLRTPLTEIRWGLQMVLQKEQKVEEQSRMTLQKSLESANRLVGIVNEMVRAKSFEQNMVTLHENAVGLADLVREIVGNLDLLAQQKEVSVGFEPPSEELLVNADREKLKLAIENVVDNAIRYSPRGKVLIAVSHEAGKADIRVQDSGIGITPDDYKRLFSKFFRGSNAMLAQPDGSGVGLYATKNIIEQHGGSVDCFSTPNKGTTFLIRLPLQEKK